MSPLTEGFFLGVIATSTLACGLIFLKFWRKTRDPLFMAFAASFLIEGLNRAAILSSEKPNEHGTWTYIIRLLSFALIIAAILKKNYPGRR